MKLPLILPAENSFSGRKDFVEENKKRIVFEEPEDMSKEANISKDSELIKNKQTIYLIKKIPIKA